MEPLYKLDKIGNKVWNALQWGGGGEVPENSSLFWGKQSLGVFFEHHKILLHKMIL